MTNFTGKKFKQRDIWLARVAFRDNPSVLKPRPVVIVGNEMAIDIDVIVDPITDLNNKRDDFDVEVIHWQVAGLAKPSIVRTSKPTTMHESMFIKRLGEMHEEDFENVLEQCRKII
jgi:mRNA interferase MazF